MKECRIVKLDTMLEGLEVTGCIDGTALNMVRGRMRRRATRLFSVYSNEVMIIEQLEFTVYSRLTISHTI